MELSAGGARQPRKAADQEFDAVAELRIIARPRLTGSEGAEQVTAHVRERLEGFGYRVGAHDFQFNPWTGRIGISIVGGVYTIGAFAAAALLYALHPYAAIAVLSGVLLFAIFVALFATALFDRLPWSRQQGSNLLALPAQGRAKYLIVAHRDSKSQPVPLSFRGPAIVFAIIAWAALALLAVLSMAQPVARSLLLVVGIIAVIAGVILVFCWVENNSPGALDNGSGVATLLGIAARERAAGDVAFLVTDAEELGLAGARAICRKLPTVVGAINLDGIDDDGAFHLIERFGWPRKRGLASHLAAPLLRAADQLQFDARRRDAPFGIMLDHMPLVQGGTPALTIMRGTLASLRRVHRPKDDLEHMRGTGLQPTVQLVGRALELLRAQEPRP